MAIAVQNTHRTDAAASAQFRNTAEKKHFCTFQVSGRLFGVDILDVKEVNREASFTPVFHAPEEVRGYVNIRGQIYLILDLRVLLGLNAGDAEESNRLVLFKSSVGDSFGIVVDTVGDVVEVDGDEIEDRRKGGQAVSEEGERRGESEDHVSGVCKLKNALLVILNARNLLKSIEGKLNA